MTGQFLSVDPLVQQTLEAYEYANDDPLQNVDPDGSRWFGTVCEYVKATGEHEDDGTICILVNNSDFGLGNQALVRFNSASGTLRACGVFGAGTYRRWQDSRSDTCENRAT